MGDMLTKEQLEALLEVLSQPAEAEEDEEDNKNDEIASMNPISEDKNKIINSARISVMVDELWDELYGEKNEIDLAVLAKANLVDANTIGMRHLYTRGGNCVAAATYNEIQGAKYYNFSEIEHAIRKDERKKFLAELEEKLSGKNVSED